MQWLELIVFTEASCDLVLSSLSCFYFGRYAATARLTARRVGAAALTVVNAGLALEATLFLAFASPQAGLEGLAVLAVRSALLGGAAFVSLLVWRHGWRR